MTRPAVRSLAKRVVALVPPAVARRVPVPALRRLLLAWLQASLEFRPRPFTTTTHGFAFAGTTTDIIQRFVYVYGEWEPELTRWVLRFLRPGDAALDVGANCGYFTLLFARCVGPEGAVVSIEPVPTIFELLEHNVRLNGFTNVRAHQVAAGDADGEVEIFRSADANLGWSGSMPRDGSVSEGVVPRRRLDELVPAELAPRVRLVKIDTEGDDYSVLQGLAGLLPRLPHDVAVVVEVTPEHLERRHRSAAELIEFMRAQRFLPHRLAGGGELERVTDAPASQVDVVFLRAR